MKNENEYRIEDRLYVKNIKRCTCEEKTGDTYMLWCKIHQRGEKNYFYRPGAAYLERTGGKKLWLSEAAAATVLQTVTQFDGQLTALKREEYRFPIVEDSFTLYLKQKEENVFDALVQAAKDGKQMSYLFCCWGITGVIGKVLHAAFRCDMYDHPQLTLLRRSTEETIGENPFYVRALETGDEHAARQLRLYYNIATAQDCEELSQTLGVRVLPKLSEEYDKNYVVVASSVDWPLLHDSGYSLLHRPNMAMKGSTRSNWTLNPHRRSGTDAAKKEEPAISFDEFLALFD